MQLNGERKIFSTNIAGTIGHPYAKKKKKKEHRHRPSQKLT